MPALRPLATGGQSPKVDIVAVHGLNPKGKNVKDHAWDTWRKPYGSNGKLWLRDDLPNASLPDTTSLPDARIFLYEYDSRVFSQKQDTFWDAGNELLDCLLGKRRGDPRRPLIFVAHSLGGLLVKQALVNAHDNQHYADIESSVKGLVFFGTPHEGGNLKDAQVKLGFAAAKIAQSLGFGSNESIMEALRPGSLFSGFLREAFRHQLENYNIVSFWEKKGTIVTKESATFGLPGHRENIIGLEASHSDICRFNLDIEEDRDVYEFVKNNMYWVYEEALKGAALEKQLEALQMGTPVLPQEKALQITSQFDEDMSTWKDDLNEVFLDPPPENILDWLLSTSGYRIWSGIRTDIAKRKSIIWCQTHNAPPTANAIGQLLLQEEGVSLIHVTNDHPSLSGLPLQKDMGCSEHAISSLFSVLQQAYALSFQHDYNDFSSFVVESVFYRRSGATKNMGMRVSSVFAEVLKGDPQKGWTIFIHDVDSLHKDASTEIEKLLARLFGGSSGFNIDRLRVVAIGQDPGKMPQVARHCTVIKKDTEYLECLASLRFQNMTVRRDRIASATIGTNHWIWDNPSYLSWKSRPSSVIWICGKPGSGKSVLAKTMQTKYLEESSSTKVLVLSWFYSARDNLVLHRQMFLAILNQILSQDVAVFSFIKGIYRSLLSSRGDVTSTHWSVTDLQEAISAILHGVKGRPVSALCVVDGLDESNTENSENDCSRWEALRFLTNLTSKGMPLRITFLSRPSDDIKRALKNQPSISMHEVNRPDIEYLIDKGVGILALRLDGYDSDDESPHSRTPTGRRLSISGLLRSDSMQDDYFKSAVSEKRILLFEIDNYLRVNAKGVVLWVITVLDILQRRCQEEPFCDIQSLTEHLESLPFELTDLYSRIVLNLLRLFQNSPNALLRARRALMWVAVSSKYRMQLEDLREIISYDFENRAESSERPTVFVGLTGWSSFRRQLEKLCGPFIEIIPILPRGEHFEDPETTRWDTVQLAHESVRTFLQNNRNSLELGFSSAEAERVVREERRIYMRRTLPPLTPLLLSGSAQHTDDNYSTFCKYIDSRPVLCFILKTLEFELQHFVHQKEGKALLANAITQCCSITDRLYSPHQESGLLSVTERNPSVRIPPLQAFPFLLAGSLLRVLGYIEFNDPVDHGWGRRSLEKLFYLACSSGQLNTVNTLSALLPDPQLLQQFAIAGAIMDVIDEMDVIEGTDVDEEVELDHDDQDDLDHDYADFDIWSKYTCVFKEAYEPVTRSTRVRAAVTQVFGNQTFNMRFYNYRDMLAGLEADSPFTWQYGSHGSMYHRTPFTELREKVSE